MNSIKQKIPEGWSVKKLKDVANVITGSTPPTSDLTNYGTEYLFVSPVDIKDNVKFINNTVTKLSFKGHSLGRVVSAGSPLFVCIGSTIGKIAIAGQTLTTNQQINSCIVNNQNDNEFLYYVLLFNANKIRQLAGEQAVPIINKSTFEKISFIFPPLPEQEKIAGILGTWDEVIEKLSTLIEKKKLLKKGLMQKLLTGKHRLKGFSTPWHEVRLGELIKSKKISLEKGKNLTAEQLKKGNVPVIAGGKTVPYYHASYTHDKPSITISASGAYAGYVWFHKEKIWASDCNVIQGSESANIVFWGYILQNQQDKIYRLQTGGAQPHIYSSDIKSLIVPELDMAEQKAIAEILSKADEEIELLNKKLEAFKQEKKALMQQLLTGKIRVKVN